MAKVSKGSGSGMKLDGDDVALESAIQNLELREGELDDVYICNDDFQDLKKQARWMAVARVHTNKPVSASAVFDTLRGIWGLAHNPELREVDDNLFTFKFFCLGDWNKVMHQGLWMYKKLVVVMAEYDGLCNPKEVKLDRTTVWAQIHAIPEVYRITKIVDELARRIGKVHSVEMKPTRYFEGDYVRVRVKHDVRKPLVRFVSIVLSGKRSLFAEIGRAHV